MSKSVKRVVKNSFFQVSGALCVTALNLVLMLGYAHFLGPESFGSLVTSQAKVLIWCLLVDLGLSHGMIGALTGAEGGKTEDIRQGFRSRDLLLRVLGIRILGASIGAISVYLLATKQHADSPELIWQDMAYVPYLFAMAFQQSAISYASFNHKLTFSVIANLLGIFATVALSLHLASIGAPISSLLLAQCWGGFFTGAVVFGYFFFESFFRKKSGSSRRQSSKYRGPWRKEAWRALAKDAWPYAVTFAVFVIWQRLDQIAASTFLGLGQGGQYALAIRLVAIPILIATSVSFAVFPDMQRISRDNPQQMSIVLGAITKAIYRYGILLIAFLLVALSLILKPFMPQYALALKILPSFIPGVWGFWLQISLINALFGQRRYSWVIQTHLLALLFYLPSLYLLPKYLGLYGIVWSFNIFCLSMFIFSLMAIKKSGIFPKKYSLFSSYTNLESAFWIQFKEKISIDTKGASGAL